MNTLLTMGLSNLAVAAVLAAIAWAAGRWLRRPALTHGLWLLVFLKLLTPPMVAVPVIRTSAPAAAVAVAPAPAVVEQREQPAPPAPAAPAQDRAVVLPKAPAAQQAKPIRPAGVVPIQQEPAGADEVQPQEVVAAPWPVQPLPNMPPPAPPAWSIDWSWLPMALCWTWLTGAVLWLALASVRLVQFHRLLGQGQAAPTALRRIAKSIAERMQVDCPRLVLVPGVISPMLWVFGRVPRLVLPAALVDRLSPEQWRTLLAHELAHWRRRDHWVRWLELATLSVYWWCPLVWWAKQQLQEAEEECCDAWVVTMLPGAARAYALALVETVDFLSGARAVLPPAASGLGHVHLLQRRLTMILRGRTPRALTLTGSAAVLTLGLLLLPLVPTLAQDPPPAAQPAAAQKDDKAGDKDNGDKARKEYQKLQEDYIKLQRQMEDKRRELEAKLQDEFGKAQQDLMKRMREAAQKAGFPGGGGIGGLPAGGPPGLLINPGQPGLAPIQPGAFPAANVLPPPVAIPLGGGPGRPDLERRLDDLERKLDRLIDRLGGGKGPTREPGERKTPPPPADGVERETAPAARSGGDPFTPPAGLPESKR